MRDCIRDICYLSVMGGFALCLAPEGGAKRVLKTLITVLLLGLILNSLHIQDIDDYRLELAKYREKEQELLRSGTETRDQLNRLVMEREYAAYVLKQAEKRGMLLDSVRITVRWNTEGLWVPDRAMIVMREGDKDALCDMLTQELGIPMERQEVETRD